jgi:hypothetical protein
MKLSRVVLCMGLVLFVVGCAGKPIYRGVTYDAYPDALKAQQAYFDQDRPKLKAPGVHVDNSIRILLPSRQYFRAHGVTGMGSEETMNFLLDASFANLNTMSDAIRKADVFRDVSVAYYETAEKPTSARGAFVLWLQIPDARTVSWTLIPGPDRTEQKLLTVTGLDQGAERLNIWMQELAETARTLSQAN